MSKELDRGFVALAIEKNNTVSCRGYFSDTDALKFIKALVGERPNLNRVVKLKGQTK